jgi:hypothetical protein
MSLTTKMLVFFFMAFVIGSFISGILEEKAVGVASETAGMSSLYHTWTQSTSGPVGSIVTLATDASTYNTIYNMFAWNYAMFADGIGEWVKFLICLPISAGLSITFLMMLAQIATAVLPW